MSYDIYYQLIAKDDPNTAKGKVIKKHYFPSLRSFRSIGLFSNTPSFIFLNVFGERNQLIFEEDIPPELRPNYSFYGIELKYNMKRGNLNLKYLVRCFNGEHMLCY